MLFLGPSGDFAGTDSAALELADEATISNLREVLLERFAGLRGGLDTMRLAVNEEFATDVTILRDNDEVALIPPVSGGSDDPDVLVDLVEEQIAAARILDFVSGHPQLGGIVTFTGATRRDTGPEGRTIERLEYEAYASMALQQLERLAREAKRRWSAGRVAVVHRHGSVPPGDASVMIAVACEHRAEAFEACRWLIDTLKKDVPIWKKDVFADGEVRWVKSDGPQHSG